MKNKKYYYTLIVIIALCTMMLCSFVLAGCGTTDINDVPSGYIDKTEHFQEGGFQDYTDYCKYVYDSQAQFVDNKEYKEVEDDDVEDIRSYFKNFESWMIELDRADEYDFDEGYIDLGDYVRVVTKEDNKFANYTIYFFDVESLTLYYIHNNI